MRKWIAPLLAPVCVAYLQLQAMAPGDEAGELFGSGARLRIQRHDLCGRIHHEAARRSAASMRARGSTSDPMAPRWSRPSRRTGPWPATSVFPTQQVAGNRKSSSLHPRNIVDPNRLGAASRRDVAQQASSRCRSQRFGIRINRWHPSSLKKIGPGQVQAREGNTAIGILRPFRT